MVDRSPVDHFYDQSITLCKASFDAGLFDVAYHALSTAFECAKLDGSPNRLDDVSRLAIQMLAFIDEHHPEHPHSSKSSANRKQYNVFQALARMAENIVKTRKLIERQKELLNPPSEE